MVPPLDRSRLVTGTRKPIRTFEEFRDAVAAYRLPRVIIAGLELELFSRVGDKTWTIPELAKCLQVSDRGLTILCRNLATAGLLIKKGSTYRNSRLAATVLNANHPAYRGSYLDLLKNHWFDWTRLVESIRTGLPLDHDVPEQQDYRRRFTWAMHHRTLDVSPKIAAQVSLHGAKTFLDLGGGPATYAMAFLAKNPHLQATVCDRPEALMVAREIAATHKAGHRLSYLPLDLMKDEIPGTFDVVWYSNVLHIYSPEENQGLFNRVRSALNPGGRLIIQDAFLHDREGLFPEEASLFAVSMLLFTETGNTHSVVETSEWLKQAGFRAIRMLRIKKGSEDWEGGILEGRVPTQDTRRNGRRTGSTKSSQARLGH
jgi:SAM-dependent methyltransferase